MTCLSRLANNARTAGQAESKVALSSPPRPAPDRAALATPASRSRSASFPAVGGECHCVVDTPAVENL
jgi:hypothetical protein